MDGQVGLLLLVIMGVVVALVMSVASRSLSDTVLSRQEKESSAAFSVAETGIETAFNELRQGIGTNGRTGTFNDSLNQVIGDYKVSPTATFALYVKEGETAHLDLTGFNPANNLTITWTKRSDPSENISTCVEGSGTAPAAIEVKAIKQSLNQDVLSYYNPAGASCVGLADGFIDSSDGGATYRSSISYDVLPSTSAVRIKPLYSGATIQVSGLNLTTQLYLIQARGAGGDAQKEIEVRRGLDAPASIFDFAVFSGGTIVK